MESGELVNGLFKTCIKPIKEEEFGWFSWLNSQMCLCHVDSLWFREAEVESEI